MLSVLLKFSEGNNKTEKWVIKVDDVIFSTPTVHGNTIFIGTEGGKLLWIDAETGSIFKSTTVEGPIRSSALVFNNKLIIESAGRLYCFETETGKLIYKVTSKGKIVDMQDPWDYFHPSPVEYSGRIYFAGNDAKIYCIDPSNGKILSKISTQENAQIRGSITFHNNNLYFGDSNGVLYEYNLASEKFTMVYKTFNNRPYSTYGMITGGPFIHNEKILFSNRNETFTPLILNTKSTAWSRTDKNGSWWSLVPVVVDDKIIIGGSDNCILSAINVESGKVLWDFSTDYNMFCKPLVIKNALIVGTGDAYANRTGSGSVYAVDIESGKLINKYNPKGNVFASPIKYEQNVIICSTTGYIQCVPAEYFTNPKKDNIYIDGNLDIVFKKDSSTIKSIDLYLNNTGETAVKLTYRVNTDNLIPDSAIRIDGLKDNTYSNGISKIQLQINRSYLKSKAYKGEIVFEFDDKESIISKPFTLTVEGDAKINEPEFEIKNFLVNPNNPTISYSIKVIRNTKIACLITPVNSDSIIGYIPKTSLQWGKYDFNKDIFLLNTKKIEPGSYSIKFKSKDEEVKFPLLIKY